MSVRRCTIFNGDYDSYKMHEHDGGHPTKGGCEKVNCKRGVPTLYNVGSIVWCVLTRDDVKLIGAFGEPAYKFVKIEVSIPEDSKSSLDLSLATKDSESLQGWKSEYMTTHAGNPNQIIREFVLQEINHEYFQDDPTGLSYLIDLPPRESRGAQVSGIEFRTASPKIHESVDESGGKISLKTMFGIVLKSHRSSITYKVRPQVFGIELSIELGGLFTGFVFIIGFVINLIIDSLVDTYYSVKYPVGKSLAPTEQPTQTDEVENGRTVTEEDSVN